MKNSLAMSIGQGRPNGFDDVNDLIFENSIAHDARLERIPLDVLHHQVGASLVFRKIINGDDVSVLEFCNDPCFALKARQEVRVFHKGWV